MLGGAINTAYFVAIALKCANQDILTLASADAPFATQKGYGGQVLGTHPAAARIAEDGVHGTPLPGGETLRLGKVADPDDPSRKAFAFIVAPGDPKTSGSWRSEFSFAPNIEHDKVYWAALSVYVYDWGNADEPALFGMQLHSGDNSRRLSPVFAINTAGRKHLQVVTRSSASPAPTPRETRTYRYDEQRLPFGRWIDFTFKFRLNTQGQGFLHAWMDGRKIAEHEGSLGFNTPGHKDYLKFGYYNWSQFDSPRKVLVRSPMVVLDPTGEKYKAEDLRAMLKTRCG
jgi:hypothetical protein